MLSAPLATEKPIETKETFSFDEFTYTNDECKYVIQLSLTEDHIVFKITENGENGVPSRKYVNEFTLEDLLSKSKLFKMFDSISETKELFNHVLTTNSYTINKSSNCLVFKFNLNSFKSEDVSLSIAQLSLNEDIALNGLCNSVSNLNKKYIDYQSKYEQLKQTVELLEDRMERIIIEKKEVEVGNLINGNGNPKSKDYNSLSDYIVNGDDIEIRIPWLMFNVSNPSKKMIIDDFNENKEIY